MADISTEITEIQEASYGSEVRQSIVDGLNKVNAGTLPSVSVSDASKFLMVNNNGQWEVGSGGLIPTPTGTKNITENGTYDVTNYASASVNVQGGGGGTIEPLSVTQNGTYTPPSGVDGYAPVVVNVYGGIEVLTPAYEGLSCAFCGGDGQLSTWTTKTNYMSFFEVSANTKYLLFAANDAGNRFRATFYSGKTISDFIQYIENPYAPRIVYTGSNIAYENERSEKGYFYTPNSQGTIAVLTSSESQTAPVVVWIMQ